MTNKIIVACNIITLLEEGFAKYYVSERFGGSDPEITDIL